MDIFLSILAVLLGITGIIGSVVPVLPGVIIAFAGLLCSFFTADSQISEAAVWIWLVIVAAVSIADYFLPAYLTKIFGGSRAAVIGATVGLIAGLFFTPVGMVLGTFLGAVAGELLHDSSSLGRALKAGTGAFLSFIVGTGIKLAASFGMMFYILRDIFPPVAGWMAGIIH